MLWILSDSKKYKAALLQGLAHSLESSHMLLGEFRELSWDPNFWSSPSSSFVAARFFFFLLLSNSFMISVSTLFSHLLLSSVLSLSQSFGGI